MNMYIYIYIFYIYIYIQGQLGHNVYVTWDFDGYKIFISFFKWGDWQKWEYGRCDQLDILVLHMGDAPQMAIGMLHQTLAGCPSVVGWFITPSIYIYIYNIYNYIYLYVPYTIVVIASFTNLANELAPHPVAWYVKLFEWSYHQVLGGFL